MSRGGILLPGMPGAVNMDEIQKAAAQQAAARTAMIHNLIQNTGSSIYANLAGAYFCGLPEGAPPDIEQLRKFAVIGKEMAVFYAEACGLINISVENKDEGKTG